MRRRVNIRFARRQAVLIAFACIIVPVFLVGCTSIGSTTIAPDRFNYSAAISESWKEQMLLNVVKLRYADAPIFLDVASVINQYTLEGSATVRAGSGLLAPVTARGTYIDKPTITYMPLSGKKFLTSLMTPIPPTAILHLIQSGWQANYILELTVQAMNGVRNTSAGVESLRLADPEFVRLLELVASIQRSGAMGVSVSPEGKGEVLRVMFADRLDPKIRLDLEEFKQILGLNAAVNEYKVIFGVHPEGGEEIAMLSRSILMILELVGAWISVPEEHVEKGVVPGNEFFDRDQPPRLVHIRSGTEPPGDVYTAVRFKDYWFWIDATDYRSKRVFSFLMSLMTLTEKGEDRKAPVLTLPTG